MGLSRRAAEMRLLLTVELMIPKIQSTERERCQWRHVIGWKFESVVEDTAESGNKGISRVQALAFETAGPADRE